MELAKIIIVGAGQRGNGYASYTKTFPEEACIVAVCEPNDDTRKRFAEEYGIPEDRQFRDWRDLIDLPIMADAVAICNQDAFHKDPAIALAKKGYNILLEKPMATSIEDCQAIHDAATSNGVIFAVCHVLRYTAPNQKLKELIDQGTIGKVQNIQLLEPVGYWHQAHSYVRGNWRNEQESSPMLLAKSCHDIDLLNYLIPSKCVRVSSFGHLSHFTKSNQPAGAADRCTECPECVEKNCAYSALKIYVKDHAESFDGWPVNVLTPIPELDSVMEALREGPYGRCVYACDNNVVDHQVVNMEFEDNTTATFTMTAFTKGAGREIYIMGDQGTLRCTDAGIEHYNFLTDTTTEISLDMGDGQITSGHGGGDFGLMKSFVAAVRNNDPKYVTSGPDVSLQSHLIVFAAERARLNHTVEAL